MLSFFYRKFTNMDNTPNCFVLILLIAGTSVAQQTAGSTLGESIDVNQRSCDTDWAQFELLSSCQEAVFSNIFTEDDNLIGNPIREALENFCRTFDGTIPVCAQNVTSMCNADIKEMVTDWVAEYRGRFCEPGTNNVEEHGRKYLDYIDKVGFQNLTVHLVGFGDIFKDADLTSCVSDIVDTQTNDALTLDLYTRYYNAIIRCYRVEISYADLPDEIKSLAMYYVYTYYPIGIVIDPDLIYKNFTLEPRAERRSSVKVFGDPHMKVHKQGHITCGAPGWVNYLINKYVEIRGENTEAFPGSPATYMTAVYIGFRNSSGGMMYYAAGNSTLPKAFNSGGKTVFTGTVDQVILEDRSDNMIRFVFNASGTTIVLARFRHTFMMVVRASDNLLEESSGLLVQGCAHEIDITAEASRRKRAAVCDGVDEDVKNQCNFDYGVTGDAELAQSVGIVKELDEQAEEIDEQLSDKEDDDKPKDGSTSALYSMGVIVLCLVASI